MEVSEWSGKPHVVGMNIWWKDRWRTNQGTTFVWIIKYNNKEYLQYTLCVYIRDIQLPRILVAKAKLPRLDSEERATMISFFDSSANDVRILAKVSQAVGVFSYKVTEDRGCILFHLKYEGSGGWDKTKANFVQTNFV